MKRCLVLLFLNGTIVFSFGQQLPDSTSYKIKIQRTTVPIKVDGILNEDVWKTADVATDFWEIILRDKEKAKRKTEFRLAFDDDFLYVSTYCEDTRPYISNTLKRDINGNLSDDIWIAIDPLKQKTNGFVFFLTAMNVQGDGAYSMNTLRNIAFSWDAKWYSAVKHHENYWTSEIAIPFKSFNYSADKKEWGINFYRVDMKNGQYSGWTKIPININWNDFGFFGSLIWDEDPPPSKKNIAIIPYSSGSSLRNNQITAPAAKNLSAGLDTKIGITPSLNLNLTLNPDFSQVEVDQQITNLTRFNIFFPERRNFFLENADLFSDWGAQVYNDGGLQGINPFYSRTIGLDQSGNPITILGGARVTGNINQDWRVGLMNIQTQRKGTFAAQNYTAATVKRQLLKRSTIGGYFFNRQAFQNETEKASNPLN
ncbi:MAG TPA: DUF5916 domain-containing protein, partial [Flavisolibacter sp.]|nr:DUF5916 domain-containing protein [Flavisolibacter sp.]